jgi:ethanolamine ammonia-lyase small subunit
VKELQKPDRPVLASDDWAELRKHTKARIALGHAGGSLPGREVLALQLAHANAKDAIDAPLDSDGICAALADFKLPVLRVESQAVDRAAYLQRPDLGGQLAPQAAELLRDSGVTCDVLFVIADGLSPQGVNLHAVPLLEQLLPALAGEQRVTLVIAEQARVAIADPIAEALGARFSAILIGERPGLSSPNSLGVYTTFAPKIGTTNERRNCISNIHQHGLSYVEAARQVLALHRASLAQQCSGVALKLEAGSAGLLGQSD